MTVWDYVLNSRWRTKVITLIVASVPVFPVYATELDISSTISDRIFELHPGLILTLPQGGRFACSREGRLTGGVIVNGLCDYEFQNMRTVSRDVEYSEVKRAAIPDSIHTETWSYKNCNAEQTVQITDSIQIVTQEGASFTKSTSIVSGNRVTSGFNISLPVKGIKLGVSESRDVTFSKTDAWRDVEDYKDTVTVRQGIQLQVQPLTEAIVTLEKTLSGGYVEVKGTLTVDADVVWYVYPSRERVEAGKISDLLPNPADRKIDVLGEFWNVTSGAVKRTDSTRKLDPEVDCN